MDFPPRQLWPALALGFACVAAPAVAQEAGRDPADLFKTLDKNNDGVIKADEVEGEQKRHFDRLIRIADKDKNGELSREEFTAGVRPEERPAAGGGERPAGDRPAFDGGRLFERLDVNKDGKVTLDEVPEEAKGRLRPLLERLGKDSLTREEFTRAMSARPMGEGANAPPDGRRAEEFFRRLDANGDGTVTVAEAPEQGKRLVEGFLRRLNRGAEEGVSRDEFVKLMGEARPGEGRPGERPPEGAPGERRPQLPRLFERLDTDRNGRITKAELAKAAEQFDVMDENKDGELDPRELLGPPPAERRPEGQPGERRPGENRPGTERPAGERPPEGRRPEGNPENAGRMVDEIFSRQDSNNDDRISKDEAKAILAENFYRIDADKDGFVTKEELRRAMAERLRNQGNRPEGRRPEGQRPQGQRPEPERKPE